MESMSKNSALNLAQLVIQHRIADVLVDRVYRSGIAKPMIERLYNVVEILEQLKDPEPDEALDG